MNLEHSFTVPVGIDEAWKILVNPVDGGDVTGTLKVKLGPIGLTYQGTATVVEKDEAAHRLVIDVGGRDARGNGTAHALVTATLSEVDGSTTVTVDAELDLTGKPAEFDHDVVLDAGNALIKQFADSLFMTLSADDPAEPAPAGDAAEPAAADDTAESAPADDTAESAPADDTAGSAPADDTAGSAPADDIAGGVADSAAAAVASVEPLEPSASAPPTKPARKRTPRPKPNNTGPAVAPEIEAEVTSEDIASSEGSTGGPIERAALAAVADGPGAYSSPGASDDGSSSAAPTNGTPSGASTSRPAFAPRDPAPTNVLAAAAPAVAQRLAPAVGAAAIVALIIWRRRR